MKLTQCIAAVNTDKGVFLKHAFMRVPVLFAAKFWKDNMSAIITFAVVIGVLASIIGSLMLGAYIAFEYFPDSRDIQLWLPIAVLWVYFLVIMYIVALFKKCKADK